MGHKPRAASGPWHLPGITLTLCFSHHLPKRHIQSALKGIAIRSGKQKKQRQVIFEKERKLKNHTCGLHFNSVSLSQHTNVNKYPYIPTHTCFSPNTLLFIRTHRGNEDGLAILKPDFQRGGNALLSPALEILRAGTVMEQALLPHWWAFCLFPRKGD